MRKPLTDTMRLALENLADGKPAHGPLTGGRSEAGGRTATMRALLKRRLIWNGAITPAGLAAIGRTDGVTVPGHQVIAPQPPTGKGTPECP